MKNPAFFSGKRALQIEALAHRIVPPSANLDEASRQEMYGILEHALSQQPESLRTQFGLFLRVIDILSFFRGLSPFRRLSPAQQDKVLSSLDRSRMTKLRLGFTGLKTMLVMGYYGRQAAGSEIGYAPRLEGGGLQSSSEAPR